MAEFKLGRIRFVWQGDWVTGHQYIVDDVISNGGKSYICVVNHTSSAEFITDLEEVPSRWSIVADGISWKGDWIASTYYNAGDIVKYGALVYVCNTAHLAKTYEAPTWEGLEPDIENWDLFASSFSWKGPWATSTRYKKNDFVSYGGTTYVCKTGHTSSDSVTNGLEIDIAKWDVFNQGITYLGDWNPASVRYKLNDVVKYGADLWICVDPHTSSATFDEDVWDVFVNGLQFENSWDNTTEYQIGDTVTYGGYSFIAKTNNVNKQPTSNPSDWEVFTTGFNFQGEWTNSSSYRVGDVVRVHGYTYVALLDNTGQEPPNAAYWSQLNSGLQWTNTAQTYLSLDGVNVDSSGSGAKFDVERTKTVYSVSVNSSSTGSNYQVNDTIKILGSAIGGISPANDVVITVTGVTAGAIDTITWQGSSSTWSESVNYYVGDVVVFGVNSYICVDNHIATLSNRPDADETGDFWNLLTAGSEYSILTETGDLVYMGANGPVRLPAGVNGQVLRSQDGYPVWANYGLINNLVYVGPLGRDVPYPEAGATIDQPWKSVRYAAKQIEDGYLNPNAKSLLARNKQFLMKEVTNWIDYTYNVSITASSNATNEFTAISTATLTENMPITFSGTIGGVTQGTTYYVKLIVDETHFTISTTPGGNALVLATATGSMTGSLAYDSAVCERDTGLLVDAVTFDITHGGTAKTTAAALSYFTPAGSAFITNNFGAQAVQTVAAYNYLSSLIASVLNNTAPSNNYQELNNVSIVAEQIIDTSITAESTVVEKAQSLISIITTGITAGVATAVPPAVNSNTTISVKTGTYSEVLPIVVPANAAIVGDELRGTIVQPAPANPALVNDKEKTISALNRIKSVIPGLVANIGIPATAGNTATQSYLFTSSENSASTAIKAKASLMAEIISSGLTAVPAFVYPDPTGYDSGFSNARRLILANKQFLKDEVVAFMNTNYSTLWNTTLTQTQRDACTRDVSYIVDALVYDLTYGTAATPCNLATVIAARSYYSNGAFVEDSGEKVAALAVQARIKSIIDNIAIGNSADWIKSTGNTTIQDISGTPGSADAATFAQNRIQEIYDTIDTGTAPTTLAPSTSWVSAPLVTANTNIQAVKSSIQSSAIEWIKETYPSLIFNTELCSRDVGYIIDALCYDMMFGSNFLSSWNAMSYYRALTSTGVVLSSQFQPTLSIVGFIAATVKEVTIGSTNTVGNLTAVNRVESSANAMYDMASSGLGATPSLLIPDPVGYGTTLTHTAYAATGNTSGATTTYNYARAQLLQNDAFIKADVSQFIINNYSAVWTALGAEGQAACQRDIDYILDAIRYDITYGGNTQTLITGSAYYSNYVLTVADSEITAVNAAYDHLKTIVSQIVLKQSVTPQAGNLVGQVTVGSAGNAASANFVQNRVQDILDWIANGEGNTKVAPCTTWAVSSLQSSFAALQNKKTEVRLDTVAWVKKFYQELNFNEDLCSRDTELIIDALSYDLLTGSNFASIQVGRSYNRALTSVNKVVGEQLLAELGSINFIKNKVKMIVANGGVAQASLAIDDITNFIIGGKTPRLQLTNPTSMDSTVAAGITLLIDNKKFIESEIIAYIAASYPSVVYNQETCRRDVGYIIDALRYDLAYGYGIGSTSNYAVRQAGLAYYSGAVLQIDSNDKSATIAAYGYLKTLAQSIVQDSAVASPLQNTVTQVRAALGQAVGSASTATSVGTLVDVITTIINDVANAPAEDLPETTWVDGLLSTSHASLQSNKTIIRNNVINYINTNFPTLTYDSTTCSRDVGLLIDAVGYDMMFNSNYRSIEAGRSYYRAAASMVVGAQKNATLSSFRYLKTLMLNVVSTNELAYTRVKRLMDIFINILDNGVGSTPEVHGTVSYNNSLDVIKVAEILRANKLFLENEATAWITDQYPTYEYDVVACRRDMGEYIDALIYDLQYTGNYKSLRAANLYKNAVEGSLMSDMFLVRNSTGIRNMTLNGLSGTLTEINDYGTKRPTAGAYVSLDPGFGPNDRNVWVTTKSCYVQNVTNFGSGCVGCKIDGALHSGGNRSIVANDFTQILSDGIGVWCTGSESLTELVSVFAYYTYSGYLAELGGRIRATNGNSSYGTYGVIAEGTDTYEQPINANLDNLAQDAVINLAVTDGNNKVLRLEYGNAGRNYTNPSFTVTGDGYNVVAIGDELRDSAIFETRLIDLNDGNGYGGSNYGTAINAAQGGDRVSVTIANSDVALSTAYVGMRIQLTSGSGVGQYANILTYNNGTKLAQGYKDSFTSLAVTATTGASDLITVSSNATLYADMPIYFTGTAFGNLTSNTLYYVKALTGTTQFTVYTNTSTKATIDLVDGSGSLTLLAAGWDHVVPGTAFSAGLDLTTNYIIEPRISYTEPGYTATARTSSSSGTWGPMTYANGKFVSLISNGVKSQYSTNGKTWTAGGNTSVSNTWVDVVYGGGQGATATAVVGGLGGAGAVLEAVMGETNSIGAPGVDQVVRVKIINGGYGYKTAPTIVFTPTSGGSGAVATCTVLNGKIDSVTVTINGSGYNAAPTVTAATDRVTKVIVNQWGKNYGSLTTTVTFSGGGSSNQATGTAVLTNGGVSSVNIGNDGGSGYTSTPTVTITDTNAKFIAIPSGTNTTSYLSAASANDAAWTNGGNLPFTSAVSAAYGNSVWVTVGGAGSAASTGDGVTWVARTIPTLGSGTYSAVAYGAGTFVAVSTGSNATAYSTNGTTWVAGGTLPSSTTWSSIAYGNGRFVAIASGGRAVAYSIDNGATWATMGAGLPSSQTWTKISYGQGLFVAVASSAAVCATSPDGINWTSRTMPGSATNWNAVVFGNPSNTPIWAATSVTSGTTAASLNTGARALGRMKAQAGDLLEVRMIEPGSAYPKGTITATAATTNLITVDTTENLVDSQPIVFAGLDNVGLITDTVYYVIGSTITSTQFKVGVTAGSATAVALSSATGLNGSYRASPIITQTDPSKVKTAPLQARQGDGVLANPSFSNRGTGNTAATAIVSGDGTADLYQPSTFISVNNLYAIPQAGSNVVFGSIAGTWYKLVAVTNVLGNPGDYTATFQISPGLTVLNAPAHGDSITTTNKYSQVRLTGHDFLYIGTGNAAQTNFPFVNPASAIQANQELASGGGRVFFTSTDQDGNFNVGNLFGVQQSTGTATLNADAFNLSGLQSLQLGEVSVGIGSAVINQFSTDPYFTANSDNVVPTQRAIKAYITAQIGGGQSSLNVNTLTSGVVYVANDTITTTSGGQLNITAKMNFTGGIDGAPVALGFFMQR